jgi:hypothetical protein
LEIRDTPLTFLEQFVDEFVEWRIHRSWPVMFPCRSSQCGDESKFAVNGVAISHQQAPQPRRNDSPHENCTAKIKRIQRKPVASEFIPMVTLIALVDERVNEAQCFRCDRVE